MKFLGCFAALLSDPAGRWEVKTEEGAESRLTLVWP